jgi:hypothetical protein
MSSAAAKEALPGCPWLDSIVAGLFTRIEFVGVEMHGTSPCLIVENSA